MSGSGPPSTTSSTKKYEIIQSKHNNTPRYFGNITLAMIDEFLTPIGKPQAQLSKLKYLPPSATGGMGFVEKDEEYENEEEFYVPFSMRSNKSSNKDYVNQYQDDDDETASVYDHSNSIVGSHMSQIESVTTFQGASEYQEILKKNIGGTGKADATQLLSNKIVYDTYNGDAVYDTKLPIFENRQTILNLLSAYNVCIIQGGTGCGKTTQVPQYIFDDYRQQNKYCNIIITQPRRIAAVSVAARVCAERNWTLGTVCGYQIGLDKKYLNHDTRICYVTTGILLQKLIIGDVEKYTHIIIDEVHERDLDVDFVLLVLKILIKRKNTSIKIILMSATIDSNLFATYYTHNMHSALNITTPVIDINGRAFEVEQFYLDDLPNLESNHLKNIEIPELKVDEPKMFEPLMRVVIYLLKYFDELEVNNIKNNKNSKLRIISGFAESRGSVLIFVPGMNEIQTLENMIKTQMPNANLNLLPLHSDIAIDQQKRVFERVQTLHRKVIISTSIAESSITVPDIKYVIDFCLTRELWCDPYTNYTHLRYEWSSESSIDQRKGRAGRVSDGTCFRLITKQFRKNLVKETVPAILRVPLTKLILNVKRLKQGEPKRVLSLALTPPNLDDIERSILLLKEAGALTIHSENGEANPNDGELTYAGQIMAALPIDIKYSKLILLGQAFGKLRECIIIAAALSTKTFFVRFFKSYLEAYTAKWYWAQGSFCDCISILNLYSLWEEFKQKGKFATSAEMRQWARTNMADLYRLNEVSMLKSEIERRLKDFKIYVNSYEDENYHLDERSTQNTNYDINDTTDVERNNLIIKVLLCGAFYPNYFVSEEIDENDAYRLVGGKDIKNTVMIKGLPMDQGVLYHDALMNLFKSCAAQMQFHFEDSKGYIEFKNIYHNSQSDVKTVIHAGVYLAVQMRLLRLPLVIERLKDEVSRERMQEFNKERNQARTGSVILSKYDSTIELSQAGRNFSKLSIMDETIDPYNEDEHVDDDASIYSFHTRASNSKLRRDIHTSELRSSIITPCNDKMVEYLSNPEYLIKNIREFPLIVTEIVEFGHFYAHINMPHYIDTLKLIQNTLNSNKYKLNRIKPSDLYLNMLICTHYYDEDTKSTCIYRAKIIYLDDVKCTNSVVVRFIDFGNDEEKKVEDLYYLTKDLQVYPFQAIECKMANLKRSYLKCLTGSMWPKKALKFFTNFILNKTLYAKIFSIIDNCVRITIYTEHNNNNVDASSKQLNKGVVKDLDDPNMYKNLTDDLIASGYVERAEETHASKSSNQVLYDNNFYVPQRNNEVTQQQQQKQQDANNDAIVFKTDSSLVCIPNHLQNEISNNKNEDLYSGLIRIQGPYSPLEVRFHSIVNIGRSKAAHIERDSINYVPLEDDPENKGERLLIAAEVTLNSGANKMILRKTSLMPKIRGFTSIMCLLFAPTCEVRVSDDKKSFTGALCGLGYDKYTKRPLYTDNDIECTFDVKIDFDVFKLINTVRLAINMVIGDEASAKEWSDNQRTLRTLQQKTCSKLLKLIETERESVPMKYFPKYGRWNQIPETQSVNIVDSDLVKFENTLYSVHSVAALQH